MQPKHTAAAGYSIRLRKEGTASVHTQRAYHDITEQIAGRARWAEQEECGRRSRGCSQAERAQSKQQQPKRGPLDGTKKGVRTLERRPGDGASSGLLAEFCLNHSQRARRSRESRAATRAEAPRMLPAVSAELCRGPGPRAGRRCSLAGAYASPSAAASSSPLLSNLAASTSSIVHVRSCTKPVSLPRSFSSRLRHTLRQGMCEREGAA